MKKLICLLLSVLLLFALMPAACAYEEDIRLFDLPWGITVSEVQEQLPYSFDNLDPLLWKTAETQMEPIRGGWDYDAELGGVITSRSSGLKVEDYSADRLILYFVYLPDENGLLTGDTEKTAFVHARYKLYSRNPDKDFPDLVQRFSALYGNPESEKTYEGLVPGEYKLWGGANGTMVSLTRADFPRQGKYVIYADYGWTGNDELTEAAYAAYQKSAGK